MHFDSTTYLLCALKNNLGLEQKIIENCLRMLNGFTITPNSISYDRNTGVMTFLAVLPKSEMEFYQMKITSQYLEIYASSTTIPHLAFHLKAAIQSLSYNYSLCLNDGSSHSGIYYFDSRGGKKEDVKQYGKLSFYDKNTLSHLNQYSEQKQVPLKQLIDVSPSSINNLGYMSDNELDTLIEFRSFKEKADRINSRLTSLNSQTIMEEMLKVYVEPDSVVEPISMPR